MRHSTSHRSSAAALAAFGVLAVFILSCTAVRRIQEAVEKKSAPKTLTSSDRKYQLTVPSGWSEMKSLNAEAVLQAGNPLQELYVIVITENKADFADDMTLDEYTRIVSTGMTKRIEGAELVPPVTTTLNSFPARSYTVKGTIEKLKAGYLCTTLETDDSYVQIMTWTLLSRFDENRPKLQALIDSFKLLKPAATTPASDSEPLPAKR